METIVSSNPNGVKTAYTYDAQNRLSTVVDARLPGANTSTYTYDAQNRLSKLSTPQEHAEREKAFVGTAESSGT